MINHIFKYKKKQIKPVLILILFLLMMGYFNIWSDWEINLFFKNYLALIPLQIMALIYVFFVQRKNNRGN